MAIIYLDILFKLFLSDPGLSFKEKNIDVHSRFNDIIGFVVFH